MDRRYKPTRPRAVTRIDFTYTGRHGPRVPKNITHAVVKPTTLNSVQEVHEGAFLECLDLAQVQFIEDETNPVERIGDGAFGACELLENPKLPPRLMSIGNSSFAGCSEIRKMDLPMTLEDIGSAALSKCRFRNLRIPPQIKKLRRQTLYNCNHMLSLELPHTGVLRKIDASALEGCFRLRNLAIPSTVTEFGENIFQYCIDLEKIFPNHKDLIRVLQTRFDRLAIHSLCYYHPYSKDPQTTLEQLNLLLRQEMKSATAPTSTTTMPSSIGGSGRSNSSTTLALKPQCRRDIFGMTPLHILALSTKHDMQLYQALIQFHPEDLVTKDVWGDIPLYYACSTYAPIPILELFFANHSILHPNMKLDWTKMVYNLTLGSAPVETIQFVIETHHDCYPDQPLDWPKMIMNALGSPLETLKYLVKASIDKRLASLGSTPWHHIVLEEMDKIPLEEDWEERDKQIDRILEMVKKFELKEAMSLLELKIWKEKIKEAAAEGELSASKTTATTSRSKGLCGSTEPATKRARLDKSKLRQHCRNHCPMDVIICNVLPFLEEAPKQQPRPEEICSIM
eukprot:scaffold618_cov130-Cylindrotheca_fusiformis.AAC.35